MAFIKNVIIILLIVCLNIISALPAGNLATMAYDNLASDINRMSTLDPSSAHKGTGVNGYG
uniref:Putative secreted salivary protein n=1 Tax=Xenopsylla cheopis TaxID=163159 RepID=A2IA99_XENCH|nr:putative secreted salivary protein [Xenopsylla cheopis]